MLTRKKNIAMKIDGRMFSASRGSPAGATGDRRDVAQQSGRAGPQVRRRQRHDRFDAAHLVASSLSLLSRSMRLPVISRTTSSSVGVRSVRSRTGTSQLARGDGDAADRTR
jgi:hypothetical protein